MAQSKKDAEAAYQKAAADFGKKPKKGFLSNLLKGKKEASEEKATAEEEKVTNPMHRGGKKDKKEYIKAVDATQKTGRKKEFDGIKGVEDFGPLDFINPMVPEIAPQRTIRRQEGTKGIAPEASSKANQDTSNSFQNAARAKHGRNKGMKP